MPPLLLTHLLGGSRSTSAPASQCTAFPGQICQIRVKCAILVRCGTSDASPLPPNINASRWRHQARSQRETKSHLFGANGHFMRPAARVTSSLNLFRRTHVQRNTRYVAVLATLLAALAVACAEPSAPRQDAPCSGGGTGTWDRCDTTGTTGTTMHLDTATAATYKP